MYAAIRQGKAKTGMAEELARRIKEGAIPIISDVKGFMAYYVVYAPDDTVTTAADHTGRSPDVLRQIIEHIGGEGSLGQFANLLQSEAGQGVLGQLEGFASGLFGRK